MHWGGVSDRVGRKPVVIFGCMGTITSLLLVGFAQNFWTALAGRIIGGALNGNIGVIQTMWVPRTIPCSCRCADSNSSYQGWRDGQTA
jgi:MFS family permease